MGRQRKSILTISHYGRKQLQSISCIGPHLGQKVSLDGIWNVLQWERNTSVSNLIFTAVVWILCSPITRQRLRNRVLPLVMILSTIGCIITWLLLQVKKWVSRIITSLLSSSSIRVSTRCSVNHSPVWSSVSSSCKRIIAPPWTSLQRHSKPPKRGFCASTKHMLDCSKSNRQEPPPLMWKVCANVAKKLWATTSNQLPSFHISLILLRPSTL